MNNSANSTNKKIPVGISSCLLGQPVRFNGSHKQSRFCTDVLAKYFEFHSVCPEVGIGMGTPRQAIRLVTETSKDTNIRAIGSSDATLDVTEQLKIYAQEKAEKLNHLCGYILMQKSPSCGLFAVKRYLANGHSEGTTSGIYAAEFKRLQPLMPIEEAGRLNDNALRENFLVRVFAYHEWREFRAQGLTPAGLIDFHSRYKYLVMAHSLVQYKALGKLLADLKSNDLDSIADQYAEGLMKALAKPASRKMHTNTLMHLQGYLKNLISSQDKQELDGVIQQYHQGIVPLVVPLTLLKHHLNHQPDANAYARQQVYLDPHPYELGLRNAI